MYIIDMGYLALKLSLRYIEHPTHVQFHVGWNCAYPTNTYYLQVVNFNETLLW